MIIGAVHIHFLQFFRRSYRPSFSWVSIYQKNFNKPDAGCVYMNAKWIVIMHIQSFVCKCLGISASKEVQASGLSLFNREERRFYSDEELRCSNDTAAAHLSSSTNRGFDIFAIAYRLLIFASAVLFLRNLWGVIEHSPKLPSIRLNNCAGQTNRRAFLSTRIILRRCSFICIRRFFEVKFTVPFICLNLECQVGLLEMFNLLSQLLADKKCIRTVDMIAFAVCLLITKGHAFMS